jgi:Bacteriophage HK97-gp10, putative tail-component
MAEVRGAVSLNIRVSGLDELERQFARVGKMPKKYLTKAGRAGMADVEREAKTQAPVGKTGLLKKSIKKKMETPNKRNKGVYRLRYDPKFNNDFQKPSSGAYGGTPPKAYYPASVEYGFKTKTGKVEGQFNMAKAIQKHQEASLEKVVDSLNDSIDTLLRGG